MDPQCSYCGVQSCTKKDKLHKPAFCPMEDEEIYKKAFEIINSNENREFYINSSHIEKEGYRVWPRIKETMELIRRMNYEKVGLCFCKSFTKEAKIITDIFNKNNINIISVMCKSGGLPKEELGFSEEDKIRPGTFEPMCNPVAQALLLNREKTDFNIVMGLCVGHDSLFYKYSDALCTTFAVKDRVTGHNPCVTLYCSEGIFSDKINLE